MSIRQIECTLDLCFVLYFMEKDERGRLTCVFSITGGMVPIHSPTRQETGALPAIFRSAITAERFVSGCVKVGEWSVHACNLMDLAESFQ